MRIALLAPPWYSVPPRAYGGVELLVAGLADGLVARGHQVQLVAAGPSGTLAQQSTTLPAIADDRLSDEVTALLHSSMAEDALREFRPDLVSDHTPPGLLAAAHRPFPTVFTVHGPVEGDYADLLRRSRGVDYIAISESQRRSAPDLPWRDTVHNGIAVRSYPYADRKGDYLFFLGRMHPDKGVLEAIEVAEKAGARLVIAARIHGRHEEQYFEQVVRPRLSSEIEFIGEVGFADKGALLAGAQALLFPLQWEEPYGLVVAEAQACGTPVLSLRRGAIPELVIEGRTGWLREHHLELVADVDRLDDLSPAYCRAHALEHLDIARTVRGYEAAFAATLDAAAPRPRPLASPTRTRGSERRSADVLAAAVDVPLPLAR